MEPYLVIRRSNNTPLFDEIFINYGYNKVSFIDELRGNGFIFHVITGVFGFDIPHLPYDELLK